MFRKWKGMGLTPPVLALLLFADIFVFNEEGLDSVVSSWHQFGESQRQDTRTDMLAVRSRSTDQLPGELRGTGDTKIQGEISRKSLFFPGEVAVRCWSLRLRGLNSSPTMTQCGVICGIAGADHEPRIALAALAQVLPSAFLICCTYQTVPFHWTMHQRNRPRPDQTRRGVGIWKVPTALLNFEYIRGRPFWEGDGYMSPSISTLVTQSTLTGRRASLLMLSTPLTVPYIHFRAIVLPVMRTAELVKSRIRWPVERRAKMGYGYLEW